MERLIMKDLIKWKEKPLRKPLLLTGVRQSGKTFIIKEFGRKYFDHVAYLNLEKNHRLGRFLNVTIISRV
ncbi:AAA family ATPase [Vaginisenegalia massiliensis]|uniref:AAA family ATPase n=1 Tax=Vaginisenegalia massiliensis TaxID=2058294 RepID=UPI000F5317C5|nr:AAA family ATPase [Vaginisenegalia massiliensis]